MVTGAIARAPRCVTPLRLGVVLFHGRSRYAATAERSPESADCKPLTDAGVKLPSLPPPIFPASRPLLPPFLPALLRLLDCRVAVPPSVRSENFKFYGRETRTKLEQVQCHDRMRDGGGEEGEGEGDDWKSFYDVVTRLPRLDN